MAKTEETAPAAESAPAAYAAPATTTALSEEAGAKLPRKGGKLAAIIAGGVVAGVVLFGGGVAAGAALPIGDHHGSSMEAHGPDGALPPLGGDGDTDGGPGQLRGGPQQGGPQQGGPQQGGQPQGGQPQGGQGAPGTTNGNN